MKFFGNTHTIGKTQEFGEKKFKVRSLIVQTVEQYPQTVEFQFQGDNDVLLDGIEVGKSVEIDFAINGRFYDKKDGSKAVINTLSAWKIQVK